jgi:low affinity Fe/Cu permease
VTPVQQMYVLLFSRLSQALARQAGRPATFAIALFLVFAWVVSGPFFGYSASWQLVINTISSIVTLLMVLLIQNTQNRDTQAIQMKLDELIHKNEHARNELIEIENLTEVELAEVRETQREIHGAAGARETTSPVPRP